MQMEAQDMFYSKWVNLTHFKQGGTSNSSIKLLPQNICKTWLTFY